VYERFDGINTLADLVNSGKQVWLILSQHSGRFC